MLRRWNFSVGPWLTEAVSLSGQGPQPTLQVLIVPGNPGLCTFYERFMELLYSMFGGSANLLAVSHAGHDSANLNQGKVWCLDSQIRHKVHLLREQLLGPGKPPVVIIAHSIGSYIILQAIRQLEEEATQAAGDDAVEALRQQLPKVVLLTPFLATDWSSPRQRALRMAARLAPVLATTAAAVGCLPIWVQDRLVPLVQPAAEPHTRDSLKGLMRYYSVYNNFHLAQHEFRDLDAPVKWELIRRLGKRASVVCAPQDMWFPLEHYQQMRSALPEVEEYWRDDLTHAFCLETRQCEVVAQLVHQSVVGSLPPHIAQQLQTPRANIAEQQQQQQQQQQPDGAGEGAAGDVSAVVDQLSDTQPAADMVVQVEADESPARSKV